MVQSRSHEPYAELRVGAVVWASYDGEIDATFLLALVGIVEIVEKAGHDASLPCRRDRVGMLHGHGVCRGEEHEK